MPLGLVIRFVETMVRLGSFRKQKRSGPITTVRSSSGLHSFHATDHGLVATIMGNEAVEAEFFPRTQSKRLPPLNTRIHGVRMPAQHESDTHGASAKSNLNVATIDNNRNQSTTVVIENERREDVDTVHESPGLSEVEDRRSNTVSPDNNDDDGSGIDFFFAGCGPTMTQYFANTLRAATAGYGGQDDDDDDEILEENHVTKKKQRELKSEVCDVVTPSIETEISNNEVKKPSIIFLEGIDLTNEDEDEITTKPKSPYTSELLSTHHSWGHAPTQSDMECSTQIEQVLNETKSFGGEDDHEATTTKPDIESEISKKSDEIAASPDQIQVPTKIVPLEPKKSEELLEASHKTEKIASEKNEKGTIFSSTTVHDAMSPLTVTGKAPVKQQRRSLFARWRKILTKRNSSHDKDPVTTLTSPSKKSAPIQRIKPQVVTASDNDDHAPMREAHDPSPSLDSTALGVSSGNLMQFISSQSSVYGLQIMTEDAGDMDNITRGIYPDQDTVNETSDDHKPISDDLERKSNETHHGLAVTKIFTESSFSLPLSQSFAAPEECIRQASTMPTGQLKIVEEDKVDQNIGQKQSGPELKDTKQPITNSVEPCVAVDEKSLSEHQVPVACDIKSVSYKEEEFTAPSSTTSKHSKVELAEQLKKKSRPVGRSIRPINTYASHRPVFPTEVESALSFNSEDSSVIFQEQDCWNPIPWKPSERRLAAKPSSRPKPKCKSNTRGRAILRSDTIDSMDSNKLIDEGHCAPTMFRESSLDSSYVNTILSSNQRSFDEKLGDINASEVKDDDSTVIPLRDMDYNDGCCGCDEMVEYEVDYPANSHLKDYVTDDSSHVCEDLTGKTLTLSQNQNDVVMDNLTDISSLVTPTQSNVDIPSHSGAAQIKEELSLHGRNLTFIPKQSVAAADDLTDITSLLSTPKHQKEATLSTCPSQSANNAESQDLTVISRLQ